MFIHMFCFYEEGGFIPAVRDVAGHHVTILADFQRVGSRRIGKYRESFKNSLSLMKYDEIYPDSAC